MSSVLVGMFETQAAAMQARDKLVSAGFAASAVSITGGDTSTASTVPANGTMRAEQHEEGGIARFFENLFGVGDDRDDVDRTGITDTYQEAFKRGSCGVTVSAADDAEMDKAEKIMNDCGAVDIDQKAESWRQEGSTQGVVGTKTAANGMLSALESGAKQKLQEIEEDIKIGKRAVARGGVRIFTRMTEVPVTETVRLREEHADVQRTAVDRPATEADFAAFKESSIEIREMAEEAVVSKSARVTGEVEIGKTATEREETIRETVRKTKVDVEKLDGDKFRGDSGNGRVANTNAYTAASPNRDPLSGELGAHPIGTGVGAAAGGVAAGAAAGSVAGPVGTVVGAAVGAVAGGLAGKGVAEKVDPTAGRQQNRL